MNQTDPSGCRNARGRGNAGDTGFDRGMGGGMDGMTGMDGGGGGGGGVSVGCGCGGYAILIGFDAEDIDGGWATEGDGAIFAIPLCGGGGPGGSGRMGGWAKGEAEVATRVDCGAKRTTFRLFQVPPVIQANRIRLKVETWRILMGACVLLWIQER